MCTVFPTNKTTHAIHPNETNCLHTIYPNETVGAAPVCPPERSRSGVSIREVGFVYHALCAGNLTTDAPLQGDTGGHIGTAPTYPHQTMRRSITSSHYTFDSPRQPHGVPIPHRIAHSIAPNDAVCHYPIGVILSIAQGWQVQRSLPWVTVQTRRLPPWGLYFFHHIAFQCPPIHTSGAEMHRALPPPLLKIKKCVYVMIWASPGMTSFVLK